jgi:hypothetical protein
MAENKSLRSHAVLNGPGGQCFTAVNLFKGLASSSSSSFLTLPFAF